MKVIRISPPGASRPAGPLNPRWYLKPKRAILALVILFVAIQLIPVWLLETNPPAHAEPPWDSVHTRMLAQAACFDCHSNYTSWPWYAHVAPASWLLVYDVVRARRHLNFSEWQNGGFGGRSGPELADRAAQAIQSGSMPPSYYLMMHPSANLSAAQQQQLIDGLRRSLK